MVSSHREEEIREKARPTRPIMTDMQNKEELDHIDARTFQSQLATLANTLALKVEREASKTMKPAFAAVDIFVMLRQSLSIYNLFCYVNADETRKSGSWRVGYSVAILPLIRCMVDCLYNITVILTYPAKAYHFREIGYKWTLQGLDADAARYGGDPKWDEYIARLRSGIQHGMSLDGITMGEVNAAAFWPTLSRYLKPDGKDVSLTPHQEFLKKLTFGFWQEYSGMAHVTFNGLLPIALFYTPDIIRHEDRDRFYDVHVDQMIATHLARAAGLLLCTLTEVQAHFRFDGAHINERLHEVWDALLTVPEIKELYDGRYAGLMKQKNITRD
jgi:hypothetical protein